MDRMVMAGGRFSVVVSGAIREDTPKLKVLVWDHDVPPGGPGACTEFVLDAEELAVLLRAQRFGPAERANVLVRLGRMRMRMEKALAAAGQRAVISDETARVLMAVCQALGLGDEETHYVVGSAYVRLFPKGDLWVAPATGGGNNGHNG